MRVTRYHSRRRAGRAARDLSSCCGGGPEQAEADPEPDQARQRDEKEPASALCLRADTARWIYDHVHFAPHSGLNRSRALSRYMEKSHQLNVVSRSAR